MRYNQIFNAMKDEETSYTSGQPQPLDFNAAKDFSNYEELPSKGYCRLFRAQRHGKWYVLKSLKPQYAANPLDMAMMEKEYASAVKMEHPNIAHTIGIEKDPVAGSCIVMEYVDGRTLSAFLEEKPSMTLRKKVVSQLLDAMRYYHALQIVHRDLKPSNILVTRNGDNVKIIDFGLADADDDAILKEPAYTKGYAAPEQMHPGALIDCRTDIYAFGILLRQIFPHRYRCISRRCTKSDPKERCCDVGQVILALHRNRLLATVSLLITLLAIIAICFGIIVKKTHSDEKTDFPSDVTDVTDVMSVTDVTAVTMPQQDSAAIKTMDSPIRPNPVAMPPQNSAPPIVPIPSETLAISPEHTPENHKTHDISPEQAVVLLQHYADSLFDDFSKKMAAGAFYTRSVAAYSTGNNYCYVTRYLYYLLAHLMDENTNIVLLYQSVCPPLIEDSKRYDKLLDNSSLPRYNRNDSPPEWLKQETAIQKKNKSLLQETGRLNAWYLAGCSDSILYHTRKFFPPVKGGN